MSLVLALDIVIVVNFDFLFKYYLDIVFFIDLGFEISKSLFK